LLALLTSCYCDVTIPETYCDPLGSDNIFATVRPMQHHDTDPVIVVAARVSIDLICH